jgi:hypothetical protein
MLDHVPRPKQDGLDRRKACAGFPVYGKRGTCVLCTRETQCRCAPCKRETRWYCVGCHMNCCVSGTTEKAAAIQFLRVIPPGARSDVKDVPSTTQIIAAASTSMLSKIDSGERSHAAFL